MELFALIVIAVILIEILIVYKKTAKKEQETLEEIKKQLFITTHNTRHNYELLTIRDNIVEMNENMKK